MRRPRYVVPHRTYMITKKCMNDQFLIVPSREVNAVLLYCLLVSVEKHGILLHAFCFMSNHFHLVVTDTQGELPAFMRHFLTNSSKAIRLVTRAPGSIWSGERYHAMWLLDADAGFRKCGYTNLNSVRAGLVADPTEWPGVGSAGLRFGDELSAPRPRFFFSNSVAFPEIATSRLAPLESAFPHAEWIGSSEARHAWEEEAREISTRRHRFPTQAQILGTSRSRRGNAPVRSLRPRFSTRDRDLLRRAQEEEEWFLNQHEMARRAYLEGDREVEFPRGTYGYRVFLGVNVAADAA